MTTNHKSIIVAIALLVALSASVSAAPGDLDPTFGVGGRIYPPSGSQTPFSEGNDLVIQPDQKILVSASHFNYSNGRFGLLVSRYLPNGTLDPTFGGGGSVFNSDVGGGGKLALQSDGKILVAAGRLILRYLSDGNLDTAFDGDGVLQFSEFGAYKLAIQNDGKIIVAGTKYIGPGNYGDPSLFGLARLTSDGSFDTTFGSNGIVNTAFPYPISYLGDVIIQGDGKIVAAGSTHTINGNGLCNPCNIALSRYNGDGSLDTSFGTSGRIVTPGGPYNSLHGSDVTLQADNKIVVAGHYSAAYDVGGLVIRYMPDGLLDASFGDAGQVSILNLCPFSIAVQSNGKIVVAGGTTDYDPSNSSHELGRLLSNGVLDPTFGINGRVTTVFPILPSGFYINGRAWGMAIQRDGKIVTAGYWSGTDWDGNWYWSYVAIARFLGDPTPTPTPTPTPAPTPTATATPAATPSPLPSPWLRANGKIAFTSDRDGNREIYVMDPDGTNQVRLTNNQVVDDHPTWSPDGTKIAFVSEKTSGRFAIFVMFADGTNRVEVTPLIFNATASVWDGWGMSWSPDGNRIVFQQKVEPSTDPFFNGPNDIYLVNIDGSNRQLLLSDPADDRQPSWSPDGSRILFSRSISTSPRLHHNLFTIRPDGTDLQALANNPEETDCAPTWSPVGDRIAFQNFDFTNALNIAISNADGSSRFWFDAGDLSGPDSGDRDKPAWSPDGSKIVFHVSGDRGTQIYVRNVDGRALTDTTGLTRLTDQPGNNFKPSWQSLASAACANPNPIDCADFFIRQQYRDFLNREPEPEGPQFYLDILNRCNPAEDECVRFLRGVVSANFFRSPEFQRKGNFVMYLYMVSIGQRPVTSAELPIKNDPALNDRPHYAEFVADLASISTPNDDPVLTEQKKNELTEAWLQRSQIQQLYPSSMSNAAFVQKLIETSGVSPSNQNWEAELNAGTKSRARVLREFAESPEVDNKYFKQSFVTLEYFGYLRRDPEDCHNPANWANSDPNTCGYLFHNARFNLHPDPHVMQNIIVRGFIESPEYRQRFGP